MAGVSASRFMRGERVRTTGKAVPPQAAGVVVAVMKSLSRQSPDMYQVRIGPQKLVFTEAELEKR